MKEFISQDEISRIIICDMVKKRNVCVMPNADMLTCMLRREKRRMKSNFIVPTRGEEMIGYRDKDTGKEIPFQEFIHDDIKADNSYL